MTKIEVLRAMDYLGHMRLNFLSANQVSRFHFEITEGKIFRLRHKAWASSSAKARLT